MSQWYRPMEIKDILTANESYDQKCRMIGYLRMSGIQYRLQNISCSGDCPEQEIVVVFDKLSVAPVAIVPQAVQIFGEIHYNSDRNPCPFVIKNSHVAQCTFDRNDIKSPMLHAEILHFIPPYLVFKMLMLIENFKSLKCENTPEVDCKE